MAQDLTVGIAGLGAIGLHLARALDRGVPGLKLAAASARDRDKATANVAGFKNPPRIVSNAELAACDIVVEAAPAAVFEEIATAAIEAGRIFEPRHIRFCLGAVPGGGGDELEARYAAIQRAGQMQPNRAQACNANRQILRHRALPSMIGAADKPN